MKLKNIINLEKNIKVKNKNIITERLELKEITEEDTELIVFWRSNYEIYKYFFASHAITKEEHLKWYQKYIYDETVKHFIAIEKKSMEPIGVFGVRVCKDSIGYAEISSCILDVKKRGQGFANEAVNAMTIYAKQIWDIKNIFAEVHCKNVDSQKMFQRCGFYLKDDKDIFWKFEKRL